MFTSLSTFESFDYSCPPSFEINLNIGRKVHMFLLKDQLVNKTRCITVTDCQTQKSQHCFKALINCKINNIIVYNPAKEFPIDRMT